MDLRRVLLGNRQMRVENVVGKRALVQTIVWSVIAVTALTVYRTPALLDGPLAPGAVIAALPVTLIPVVVLVVAVGVVLLNTIRELRYLLFGRHSGRGPSESSRNDPGEGGLFETLGGVGGIGGFGGDEGGNDE